MPIRPISQAPIAGHCDADPRNSAPATHRDHAATNNEPSMIQSPPDRLRILQHEAAHVVAAIHVKGAIHHVRVINPRSTHPDRRGAFGEVFHACLTDQCDAFVNLAGHAWESRDPAGHLPFAANDLSEALRHAANGGHNFNELLAYTESFLGRAEPAIRQCAVLMHSLMPKSGLLQGKKLWQCLDQISPLVPRGAQWQ